jgi:predicted nucleic acid-binding protein
MAKRPHELLEPYLYLDTNVILDFLHNRYQPSVELMRRIRERHWKCSTSSFSLLEMYDAEQLDKFIEKLRLKGYGWSQIMSKTVERRSKKLGLTDEQLKSLSSELRDSISLIEDCIEFMYPHKRLWDDAETWCMYTNIGARDAIHLATALAVGCNILVTRDKDFRRIADDYIVATFPENILSAVSDIEHYIKTLGEHK